MFVLGCLAYTILLGDLLYIFLVYHTAYYLVGAGLYVSILVWNTYWYYNPQLPPYRPRSFVRPELDYTIRQGPPAAQCIYSVHPHGTWAVPCLYTYNLVPGSLVYTSRFLHLLPGQSIVARILGLMSASRTNLETAIRAGRSPIIASGGEREAYLSSPGTDVVLITQRKTIFDLATASNVPIVVVLAFGENQRFTNLHGQLRLICRRVFGTYGAAWVDAWGIPFGCMQRKQFYAMEKQLCFSNPVFTLDDYIHEVKDMYRTYHPSKSLTIL